MSYENRQCTEVFIEIRVEKGDVDARWRFYENVPIRTTQHALLINASEKFLGHRDDDARGAAHVAESVLVLVLGHLADEFGADGAQAGDRLIDAFDGKHDAPQAQGVWWGDHRFDLDQFGLAKLCQLKPPVPIGGPHHHDVDVDIFEPVDAVHPRSRDRHLAFDCHAERGEKSDRGGKIIDDADVVQSFDRHASSIVGAIARTKFEPRC